MNTPDYIPPFLPNDVVAYIYNGATIFTTISEVIVRDKTSMFNPFKVTYKVAGVLSEFHEGNLVGIDTSKRSYL